MTGAEMRDARAKLGESWRLGRPVSRTELGEVIGLRGNVGRTISDYEEGRAEISGPISRLMSAMLDGWKPPMIETLITGEGRS